MPQPEAPAARSGANQGAAYSGLAFNGASMPTPARSLFPKLAFFHQPARAGIRLHARPAGHRGQPRPYAVPRGADGAIRRIPWPPPGGGADGFEAVLAAWRAVCGRCRRAGPPAHAAARVFFLVA